MTTTEADGWAGYKPDAVDRQQEALHARLEREADARGREAQEQLSRAESISTPLMTRSEAMRAMETAGCVVPQTQKTVTAGAYSRALRSLLAYLNRAEAAEAELAATKEALRGLLAVIDRHMPRVGLTPFTFVDAAKAIEKAREVSK